MAVESKGYVQNVHDNVLTPTGSFTQNVGVHGTTDPDASVIRHGGGEPKLRYKTHRAVDAQQEVITATLVSPGATDESALLKEVIKCHEQNTKERVETVVSDSR